MSKPLTDAELAEIRRRDSYFAPHDRSINTDASYDRRALLAHIDHLAREKGEWVPVSERLPPASGEYLVTSKYGLVTACGYYQKGGWTHSGFLAWRPLPPPYAPAKHAPACSLFGGDAHKRAADICDCGAAMDGL